MIVKDEIVGFEGLSLRRDFDDELPRVRDVDVGVQLGMAQPRDIRRTIDKYAEDLKDFGVLARRAQTSGTAGGRPGYEYWLTKDQALFVAGRSVEELEQSVHESQVMVATREDVVRERDQWKSSYFAAVQERDEARAENAALRDRADKALVRAETAEAREKDLQEALDEIQGDEVLQRLNALAERVISVAEAAQPKCDAEIKRAEKACEASDWRAKYEALLAKATLPADVLSWARAVTVGPGAMRDAARAAERFLLALHAATKSEPPKRKTRQQAASDYYRAKYGECDEYMLREGLVAAGVNPDEVVSEAP